MCKVNFNVHVGCGKLLVLRPESISLPHSPKLSLQWLELGLPHPLTRRRVCPPPFWFRGEGPIRSREGVGGYIHCGIPCTGMYVLCGLPLQGGFFLSEKGGGFSYRSSLLLWWHLSYHVYILWVNQEKTTENNRR
jgi:hypothetical protein